HMQLRERKPKTRLIEEHGVLSSRSSSRSTRRTTIASVSELPDQSAVASSGDTCEDYVVAEGPRRLSVTSSVVSAANVIHGDGGYGDVPNVPSHSSSEGHIGSSRPGSSTSMKPVETLTAKKPGVTSTPRV